MPRLNAAVRREDLPGVPERLASLFAVREEVHTPPVRVSPWNDLVNGPPAPVPNLLYDTDEESYQPSEFDLPEVPELPPTLQWPGPPPPQPAAVRPQPKASAGPPGIPRSVRLRARQLEYLDPRTVVGYEGTTCEWFFSTRFWEVVLLQQDALVMCVRVWEGNVLVPPRAPAGYRAVWRHVGTSANRRWSILREASDAAPLARVGTDSPGAFRI